MRKLPKPTDDAESVFAVCVGQVRDPTLQARLLGVKAEVRDAVRRYETAANAHSLHQFRPTAAQSGVVTTKELNDVYTIRMARKGGVGRSVYDRIVMSAPDGRCPLCGHRAVSKLDHHSPKAHYPLLSVAPSNLVPVCTDCNEIKQDHVPRLESQQTLHPYFDDIDGDRWLVAKVVHGSPAAVTFRVVAPPSWSGALRKRVKNHFELLGLGPLYSAQAATEMADIRMALTQVFAAGGSVGVRQHLRLQADSRLQNQRNSWQTATYDALASDNWFVGGGFR